MARTVDGVLGLFESPLHRKPVRVDAANGEVSIEIHLSVAFGAHVPTVGAAVQEAVVRYLERMAHVRPATVDVVVDDVQAPRAAA